MLVLETLFMRRFLSLLGSLYLCGCSTADIVVKHPDAPVLIIEGSGWVRVAIYDRTTNELMDFGKVRLEDFESWTIHKYNWDKFMREHD